MKITKSRESNFSEQPPRRRICTSWIVPLRLLLMLPAGLGLMLSGPVTAQTFTTLHSFPAGGDGSIPLAGLVLSGNTLYGTGIGGISDLSQGPIWGEVFAVNTDGTGFTNWLEGNGLGGSLSGLILSGNTLYGTEISEGGMRSPSYSGVFALNTDGTGFTNLCGIGAAGFTDFSPPWSGQSLAGLILSGNTLYGTAAGGSSAGSGTVFKVNTDGTGFTNLYSFSAPDTNGFNSDGANPEAALILSGNTLYGTASQGGTSGSGTVFALSTDGTGFTNLHSFTATSVSSGGLIWDVGTNRDGAIPQAGLILSGNTLYGTAAGGSSAGSGTVFKVNTDGTGFRVLHSFTGRVLYYPNGAGDFIYTNSDGANPYAELVLSGNTLYGTASDGGSSSYGTVFAVNTDGTGFTTLHSFNGGSNLTGGTNSDGAYPIVGLVLSGNTLYGTTPQGGTNGYGTVFSIFIQPQLTLIPSGPYVILAWPTNYSGFTLQSTTNFGPSAVWATNSSPPVVIGAENVVINTTTTGRQQFYRLSQ